MLTTLHHDLIGIILYFGFIFAIGLPVIFEVTAIRPLRSPASYITW